MKFYFDNFETQNLSNVPQISEIRNFRQFKYFYNVDPAEFVYTTDYNEPGVYLIEVSKLTHQWTGKNMYDASFDTLENIPIHVLDAVKNKKIRIVIISIVEGDTFLKEYWDGFSALTNSMKSLNLPPMSVLVVAGNVNANAEYRKWCKRKSEKPIIEFIGGTEGLDTIYNLDEICAKNAVESKFLYSSLNRAHRQSRTEHLYFLAKENILNDGLVSGGVHFNDQEIHKPKFLKADINEWEILLKNNYPREIDVAAETLKNENQAGTINFKIYRDAMLSVVTETYFHEPGLYFSEKTFKPISAGSPQINLSQPFAMKYLKDKFNIDLYFNSIDTTFDSIESHSDRFREFHEALLNWVLQDENTRKKIFINLFDQIEQNLNTIKKINFKKIIVDDIVKSTTEYFKGQK